MSEIKRELYILPPVQFDFGREVREISRGKNTETTLAYNIAWNLQTLQSRGNFPNNDPFLLAVLNQWESLLIVPDKLTRLRESLRPQPYQGLFQFGTDESTHEKVVTERIELMNIVGPATESVLSNPRTVGDYTRYFHGPDINSPFANIYFEFGRKDTRKKVTYALASTQEEVKYALGKMHEQRRKENKSKKVYW